jgi:hypothetical protein
VVFPVVELLPPAQPSELALDHRQPQHPQLETE